MRLTRPGCSLCAYNNHKHVMTYDAFITCLTHYYAYGKTAPGTGVSGWDFSRDLASPLNLFPLVRYGIKPLNNVMILESLTNGRFTWRIRVLSHLSL